MISLIFVQVYGSKLQEKKTGRASYGSDHLLRALTAIQGGTPLLRVSKEFGIPARTLRRHRDKGVLTPG